MSRLSPGFHESWSDADAAFEAFVSALPDRREQLRARLVRTDGPELDGSLESLDALNEWYIRIAFADEDDGMDWWPMWHQRREAPPVTTRWHRGAPPHLLRLWELVAVYVGDLYLARDDHARWVCWRGSHRLDSFNAKPVIDYGDRHFPRDPLGLANAGVVKAYVEQGDGTEAFAPPDPGNLRRGFEKWIALSIDSRGRDGRSWQKAPSGRGAGTRVAARPW